MTIVLPDEVRMKPKEWRTKTRQGDPVHREAVTMDEYSCDNQGSIHVGPRASKHLMEVIHRSTAGHLGAAKTLATLCEHYTVAQD